MTNVFEFLPSFRFIPISEDNLIFCCFGQALKMPGNSFLPGGILARLFEKGGGHCIAGHKPRQLPSYDIDEKQTKQIKQLTKKNVRNFDAMRLLTPTDLDPVNREGNLRHLD